MMETLHMQSLVLNLGCGAWRRGRLGEGRGSKILSKRLATGLSQLHP